MIAHGSIRGLVAFVVLGCGAAVAQSTLPRTERAKNVRGAFVASPDARDRSLLLVDDICTTGETLRACAKALVTAGAARVCAVVVAKA